MATLRFANVMGLISIILICKRNVHCNYISWVESKSHMYSQIGLCNEMIYTGKKVNVYCQMISTTSGESDIMVQNITRDKKLFLPGKISVWNIKYMLIE